MCTLYTMPTKYMFTRPITDAWSSYVDVSTPWGTEPWLIGGFLVKVPTTWRPIHSIMSGDEEGVRAALEEHFPDIRDQIEQLRASTGYAMW